MPSTPRNSKKLIEIVKIAKKYFQQVPFSERGKLAENARWEAFEKDLKKLLSTSSVSDEEIDALKDAADFISTNADGAKDYQYFETMQSRVLSVWRKLKKTKS